MGAQSVHKKNDLWKNSHQKKIYSFVSRVVFFFSFFLEPLENIRIQYASDKTLMKSHAEAFEVGKTITSLLIKHAESLIWCPLIKTGKNFI